MNHSHHHEDLDYFLMEAPDLLQRIELGLLTLRDNRTPAHVHELMRAAHTIKGAAGSVELDTIHHVAHVMEDIFKALYNPELTIDAEVESLLFQGYECLRLPIMAIVNQSTVDDADLKNRAAGIIASLQDKLGDCFNNDTPIPTSTELGFDLVHSMFETGVQQHLNQLDNLLFQVDFVDLKQALSEKTTILLGLAESLSLPGFARIAQTTLAALQTSPDQLIQIAELALTDFRHGQQAVLAGDRTEGGAPSAQLVALAHGSNTPLPTTPTVLSPTRQQPPPDPLDLLLDNTVLEIDMFETDLLDLEDFQPFESSDPNLEQTEDMSPNGWFIDSFTPITDPVATSDFSLTDALISGSAIFDTLNPDAKTSTPPSALSLPTNPPSSAELDDLFSDVMLTGVALTDSEIVQFLQEDSGTSLIRSDTEQNNDQGRETPALTILAQDHSTRSDLKPDPSVVEITGIDNKREPLATPPLPQVVETSNTSPSITPTARSSPATTPTTSPAHTSSATIRVELAKLERLDHLSGELLIGQNRQTNHNEQLRLVLRSLLSHLRQHQQTISQLRDCSDRTFNDRSPHPHLSISAPCLSPSPTSSSSFGASILPTFDALEMDRYTDLHMLAQTALNEASELEDLSETIEQFTRQSRQYSLSQHRLLNHLQDDLTSGRMQPLGPLLNRFPRMVQQLASAYNKQVNLKLHGSSVLIDKAIVDKLYDPLLHLIRNAFDHGIELPADRQAQGKDPTGTIEIYAYNRGNCSFIEIRDDGCGLDRQAIAQKAITMNLATSEQVAQMSDNQLSELLFQPGFSTAARVSGISGRGIGLDVVCTQLKQLNGSVTVTSQAGVGTTFFLRIPLSITITRLLVCQQRSLPYALPVNTIQRVIIPQPGQVRSFGAGQLALLYHQEGNDRLIPLYSLSQLLDYSMTSTQLLNVLTPPTHNSSTRHAIGSIQHLNEPPSVSDRPMTSPVSTESECLPILMVQVVSGLAAIQVDRVFGEQELVIRPLGTTIAPPPYLYGCSILSDGQLALVLDVEAVLNYTHPEHFVDVASLRDDRPRTSFSSASPSQVIALKPGVVPTAASANPPTQPSPGTTQIMLVVDDSLTLRKTLTRTLSQAGYNVIEASDGLEALQKLDQQHPISAIICDVEMPRMNGFEFLAQFRQRYANKTTPVVMLTSRTHEKYRQMAMDLGATSYVTKPYSDREFVQLLTEVMRVSDVAVTPSPLSLRST